MIRMIQSRSAKQAKQYFNDALQKSDYYLDRQEIVGFDFHGKISERIGIKKTGSKEVFHMLVENINPITGEKLTARKKDNRTIGYDINFHCPKSVSLLHVLSKDDHILDAFKQSVNETMKDMEGDSLVRVRKNNQDENRSSGELIWAEFVHQTSRPVKEKTPDPHLHCHCFTFNMAWDQVEQQFKAGQFRTIKRDMPYYQARFHKRLSDNLIKLGYRIKRTKNAFEIVGVPQNAIEMFSKRTTEINSLAKENNITNAKELDQLGSRTRAKKQKGLMMAQLQKDWRKQIHDLGINSTEANGMIIRHKTIEDSYEITPQQCVDHAIEHRFERASVFQDKRILETAYHFAIGNYTSSIHAIQEAFLSDKNIIHVHDDDITYCTTHDTLTEERRMILLATQGKAKFEPFYKKPPSLSLQGEQAAAVQSILSTKDQVSIIEGRAGTGKTTLMKEAVRLIESTGKKVTVVAPTAQAARNVLKEEGFERAETVAKLLTDSKLQDTLKDGVLWVDEAGLLGVKDMVALLQLATDQNARLILGGDTRQHASVAYGDALRLLNVLGGLSTSQVGRIYRQTETQYREAVQAISDGNIEDGFKLLDKINSITETDPQKPGAKLVKDYLSATDNGSAALIISPTHHQGEAITQDVRKALKKSGKIGKDDFAVNRLINLNFTQAEKSDIRNYSPGLVLQFNQNRKGIKRGSQWAVEDVQANKLILTDNKQSIDFCIKKKKNDFDVFQQNSLAIAKNDLVRITRNGFDINRKRLNNGQEFTVAGIDKKDRIRLLNKKSKAEYTIEKNFGHLAHAYCTTSHASQGKTVDEVFIYQPAATFPATDLKQFYVSVSRGRKAVQIYTDDKQELFNHVHKPKERKSAIELISWNETKEMVLSKQTHTHLKPLSLTLN